LLKQFDGYLAEYKQNKRCGHFSLDFYDYVIDVTQHMDLEGTIGVGLLAFLYDGGGHCVNYVVTGDRNDLEHWIVEPQREEAIYSFEDYFKSYDDVKLELLLIA